jgi:Mg/Co/Ni transporter MgtE
MINGWKNRDFSKPLDMENDLWFLNYIKIVVGTSIFTSMSIACLVASVFPVLLEKLKIDPAIATGPFVTTFIDIIGVSSYFLIAGSLLPV